MNSDRSPQANFDRIAKAYRWLEYVTLGPMLELTRRHHLPALQHCRRVLLLGDGDGRFTARLLATYPDVRAQVVDSSGAMLALLHRRVGDDQRLSIAYADARSFTPAEAVDCVVTHFFLDCFTESEVKDLVFRLLPKLAPGGLWLVSDFRIPNGLLHWPARIYVRMLYLAFRILTGLRVSQLPDFAAPLQAAGLTRTAVHRSLFGLLTTEVWRRS